MNNDLQLLIDFHLQAQRQGPGSDESLQKMLTLAGINNTEPLTIADIGCGTGAASLALAAQLNAQITAVDFLPEFIEALKTHASHAGVSDKITPVVASMEALPFSAQQFDVIWSEGAIYNMGFQKGIETWKRYLKINGLLVVSEITWLSQERPTEIQQYWQQHYAEIDTASTKIQLLEQSGYQPIAYFHLPPSCWLENYYGPMNKRFSAFLKKHNNSAAAQAIVNGEKDEIALYQRYQEYYSYGVYIAKNVS